MERKIGEIFESGNEWYQVVKSDGEGCSSCDFYDKGCKAKYMDAGSCGTSREDWTLVIFKKLEKVGEPFQTRYNGRVLIIQKYKLENRCAKLPDSPFIMIDSDTQGWVINIELKQNKEDMEEKKLNLKPFDLQKAKEGKPVCTRDGRKARIICFDVKAKKPIAALITNDDIEEVHFYYDNGRSDQYQEYRYDLMMLHEKKEGWVNVYKAGDCRNIRGFYSSKEKAEKQKDKGCVATIKITWEE